MKSQFWAHCNLRWQELLSSDEILAWVLNQEAPLRLRAELAFPGVYRFVFPQFRDGNSAHTPCYVGEGGNIGSRLRDHFRKEKDSNRSWNEMNADGLPKGWHVRGNIRNSNGEFKLQALKITGTVNLCGLILGPDTIPNPFEDSFVRKLLENWAILTSEYVDGLRPTNRRGTPHILKDLLKQRRQRPQNKKKYATQK